METRIIASYIDKLGFNEINDRNVDLDTYKDIQCPSIQKALAEIKLNDLNGCGTIMEQRKNKYGIFEDLVYHYVDGGEIYDTEEFD